MQRQELLPLLNLSECGAISPELNEILSERRAVFEWSCLVWLWAMEVRRRCWKMKLSSYTYSRTQRKSFNNTIRMMTHKCMWRQTLCTCKTPWMWKFLLADRTSQSVEHALTPSLAETETYSSIFVFLLIMYMSMLQPVMSHEPYNSLLSTHSMDWLVRSSYRRTQMSTNRYVATCTNTLF